jgi:hypothetical protein
MTLLLPALSLILLLMPVYKLALLLQMVLVLPPVPTL